MTEQELQEIEARSAPVLAARARYRREDTPTIVRAWASAADVPTLVAEVRRQMAIAAAERAYRVAGKRYVQGEVEERQGEDDVVRAIAALVALGVEP
jgi:hypothetical protein